MKKVIPFIIILCLLIPLIFCLTARQEQNPCAQDSCETYYDHFTNPAAKALVEMTQRQASSQYVKRDEQRNQMIGLSITVLVGIIGFTLSKERAKSQNDKDRKVLWVLAILFCLLMHGVDTMLADLSYRQVAYSNNLSRYLLKWDSMEDKDIKVALKKVCDGNEPVDGFRCQKGWVRKASIFFCDDFSFMFVWWWVLTFSAAGLLWWDTKKK